MSKQRESICVSGVVEARFGWNAYPKQRSGGLIGGLTSRDTSIDCDGRAIFCGKDGRPISTDIKDSCVSYDNRVMFSGAVIHSGDNKTGGVDAECIAFDLPKIPSNINQIILSLDLLKEKKKIGFGKIQEAFLRLYYKGTGEEITEANFSHLSSDTKIVIAGRLIREGDGWCFVPGGDKLSNESTDSIMNYIIG